MAQQRLQIANSSVVFQREEELQNSTENGEEDCVPKKKRARRTCVKICTKPVDDSQTIKIDVWKRKVKKMIRDGVHESTQEGCNLIGTPHQIGKLLLEGTDLGKSFWVGTQLTHEARF